MLFEQEQKMREERLNRQRVDSQEQVIDDDYSSDDGDYRIDIPETNDEEDNEIQLQNGDKMVLIYDLLQIDLSL